MRWNRKNVVIKAAPRLEAEKLRVAAYCRISSDSSDQLNSFMAQLNYYTTLIGSKENWTLADLYADEGITGTSAEKRPDFHRLLTDCRRGRMDKVLVKSVSRFARNARDCLSTVWELKSIGVGVCFEEQHIDTFNMSGELLTTVFAAMAQKESQRISENMRWSYQVRMKGGTFLPAAIPFGYVLKDWNIVVAEECIEKSSAISSGIIWPFRAWQRSQHSSTGRVYWCGLVRKAENGSTPPSPISSPTRGISGTPSGKKLCHWPPPGPPSENHGEREQYFAEGTYLSIIDRDTFLAVQELKGRRSEARSTRLCQRLPLQGMIYCGECGVLYRRKVWNGKTYWVCYIHDRDKGRCPSGRIPEEEIHAAFLRVSHKLRFRGEPILRCPTDKNTLTGVNYEP